MSFRPPYRYITATNLATLLQKSSPTLPRREVAIVDVRDDDFEGGNIVGCRNVPSTVFDDKVKELVDELKSVPTIVFHCSLSQQRGPKSARIYSEARQDALQAHKIQPLAQDTPLQSVADSIPEVAEIQDKNGGQRILVLRDGFSNFGRVYQNDPKLVEKYDVEAWQWR